MSVTREDGRLSSNWPDYLNRNERATYYAARRLVDAIETRARTIGNSPAQLPQATTDAMRALRRLSSTAADLWTFYEVIRRTQTPSPLAPPTLRDHLANPLPEDSRPPRAGD